jgi:hypothetical protein
MNTCLSAIYLKLNQIDVRYIRVGSSWACPSMVMWVDSHQ